MASLTICLSNTTLRDQVLVLCSLNALLGQREAVLFQELEIFTLNNRQKVGKE
jgi:hypothetical protein